MIALQHVDLADVGEAEHQVRGWIVEFRRVERAGLHRRHDLAARHDGDRGADLAHQSADRPTVRYFKPLNSLGDFDRLLEPAERLGRHRAGQEADQIETEYLADQFLVERLAAAVLIQPSIWFAFQPSAGAVPNSEYALLLPYQ